MMIHVYVHACVCVTASNIELFTICYIWTRNSDEGHREEQGMVEKLLVPLFFNLSLLFSQMDLTRSDQLTLRLQGKASHDFSHKGRIPYVLQVPASPSKESLPQSNANSYTCSSLSLLSPFSGSYGFLSHLIPPTGPNIGSPLIM